MSGALTTQAAIDALAVSLTVQLQLIINARRSRGLDTGRPPSNRVYTEDDARAIADRLGRPSLPPTRQVGRDDDDDDAELRRFLSRLSAVNAEVDRYEDTLLHERALDLIPFDRLHDRASQLSEGSSSSLAFQDALAQSLVEWAKKDFLRWVDPIRCSLCQSEARGVGGVAPTREEREEGGACRVELYQCESGQCLGRMERFPRYTNLDKLLQTRTGRCGEFAAIFQLLLRALSFRARYVWNSEDHVWNEYYSEELRRWVHLDSCEGARDKNLLYDQGWGKKMKYCIAFGTEGAVDVTRTYVANWEEALHRRPASWEASVRRFLVGITHSRRSHLSAEEAGELSLSDEAEERWQQDSKARLETAKNESLSGRTSGTKEWRLQRHEAGRDAAPSSLARLRVSGRMPAYDLGSANLNGSARRTSAGAIRLADDVADQTGSAFLALPGDLKTFAVEFAFQISNTAGGADGMAFVVHGASTGTRALGIGGCELGYGGLPNSVAVEIDTYRSQDRCDDPPTPHISINTRGRSPNEAHHRSSLWCTRPGSLPQLDDGHKYRLKVVVHEMTWISLFLTDSDDGTNFVQLTQGPVEIPLLCDADAPLYFGWTASTGGLHQSHEVSSFALYEAEGDAIAGVVSTDACQ